MARRSFTDTLRDIRSGEIIDQLDEQLQELVRAVHWTPAWNAPSADTTTMKP